MAVGFDTVGVGNNNRVDFGTSVSTAFDHTSNGGLAIAGMSFTAADLRILWYTDDNNIDDLTRTVTYGDVQMTSAGVVQWGTTDAWTEVFVAFGVPSGKQKVTGRVSGGASSKRHVRMSVATYSGVDSIGDPVVGTGTGTAMTIAATATTADRLVGVYGTLSGISAFNGTQRYLNNSSVSLLIGDAVGTGTSQNVTATRQKSGPWGGIVIPLNAADTVASCPPLAFAPRFDPVRAHREQRTGGLQRNVFPVPATEES